MTSLNQPDAALAATVQDLRLRHNIPGVSVAINRAGVTTSATAGILNALTGDPVHTNALFQIGSITKVFTATLAMQLVARGAIALDEPIAPRFAGHSARTPGAITLRHLLTHSSGLPADLWLDTGPVRDPERLRHYAGRAFAADRIAETGAFYSYSNVGFSIIGALIEQLHGDTFEDILEAAILEPLGTSEAAVDAHTAIRHRTALGHLGAQNRAAPAWSLFASAAPAGASLSFSAHGLVQAARELTGLAATAVADSATLAMMQQPQLRVPGYGALGGDRGFGWEIWPTTLGPVIGHDGATLGQQAFLRVDPGRDITLAILTNSDHGAVFARDLSATIDDAIAGTILPEYAAGDEPGNVRPDGRYRSTTADTLIHHASADVLVADITPVGAAAAFDVPSRHVLTHVRGDLYRSDTEPARPYLFFTHGDATYMHRGRADRRISSVDTSSET